MNKIYYITDEGVGLEFLNDRVADYLGEQWVDKVTSINYFLAK